MMSFLRPFLSRFISPFIASGLAFLALKGIDLGDDAPARLTEYTVITIIALMQLLNGPIHKLIDKKVNPGDAASAGLAVAEKRKDDAMKPVKV